MSQQQRPPRPPPADSARTHVGLGIAEAAYTPIPREEATTPPHGTRHEALEYRADVELVLERTRALEDKVDELISDCRAVTASCRALIGQMDEERRLVRDMIDRQETRLLVELGTQARALTSLDERIGRPPSGIDLRASNVQDLTAAELELVERDGTGVFRLVAQLARADRTIIAAVARVAGTRAGAVSAVATTLATTAPSWAPALLEALRSAF